MGKRRSGRNRYKSPVTVDRAGGLGDAARRGGAGTRDASTDVVVQGDRQAPTMASLLPVPSSWFTGPFAPGRPLDPSPINVPRPDSGRPEPRLWEAPVSWNIQLGTQRSTPWAVLRAAADFGLFRRCIEVRKDHMIGLDWDIRPTKRAIQAAQRKADKQVRASKAQLDQQGGTAPAGPPDQATTSPTSGEVPPDPSPAPAPAQGQVTGSTVTPSSAAARPAPVSASRQAVEDEMRERLEPHIEAARKFLLAPDRGNGLGWGAWLGQLLEEVFVLDALAIYPRWTNGGDLYSLEIIDGSTIKPLLDERGGRPLPPNPAFQQILYGFPRGDFTATVTETEGPNGPIEVIDGAYPSDQLVYCRRVSRVFTPYGYSAVEQALDDGALYLKRHAWMMSEYTDGTTISGLFTTDEATNWSPAQLLEYEVLFNNLMSGSAQDRHKARFLPPGVAPVAQGGSAGSDAIAEKYKPDYDLWLLKQTVMHFDTTLPELGHTDAAAGGLGASGYHEGQEAVQMRKRLPIIKFVEEIVTGLLHDHFGMPDELEFAFLGLDEEGEAGSVEDDLKKQQAGAMTLNELRDQAGLPRYEFPEADMPYVFTGRGLVFLEGASAAAAPVPPGYLEGPPEAPKPGEPAPTAGGGSAGAGPAPAAQGGRPDGSAGPAPVGNGSGPAVTPSAAKLAEAAAYKRWRGRRTGDGGRPFRWEHHTPNEAAALELALKAGDVDPKARAPWPGWSRDLQVAAAYEPALSRALIGAAGVATLARRWTEHGGSPETALGWLREQLPAARLASALTPVVHRLWTEAYLVGDVSAEYMVGRMGDRSKAAGDFDHATDWGAWTPGDPRAAAAILRGRGRYPGLQQLLDSGELTINSVAEHRVEELARVLARAADEGWSNDKTADALRSVLDDPRWARMVAITEVSRASSASSLSRYADMGIEGKGWMTAADQRVCPECHENEAQGAIPLGAYFQDGTDAPPGHPLCRCAIAPESLAFAGAYRPAPGLTDLTDEVAAMTGSPGDA